MNLEKKNYLEHDTKVRIIDGIISHDNNWDWLISSIVDDYNLNDIDSWSAFVTKYNYIKELYSFFIRIIESCELDIKTENSLISDLIIIARYFVGCINEPQLSVINTKFGKVLLLIVKITKIENSAIGTKYISDFGILTQKNYWKLIGEETIDKICLEVGSLPVIDIDGWEKVITTFNDNINCILNSYSTDFFNTYGDDLYDANAFSYKHLNSNEVETWEERYLLEMVYTTVDQEGIKPAMIFNNSLSFPDKSNWTSENLEHMDDFFDNRKAKFIIRTVDYLVNGKLMDEETTIDHFRLLKKYIENHNESEIVDSSSFRIIANLFKNKHISNAIKQDECYRDVINSVTSIDKPDVIRRIQKSQFPMSQMQKNALKKEEQSYYSRIRDVNNVNDLLSFLQARKSVFYLNDEQLEVINDKFISLVEEVNDVLVANLFYEYMKFLIDVNNHGDTINKVLIQNYMINTQLLWELEHYDKQCGNMHCISHEIAVDRIELQSFTDSALSNPIGIAASIKQSSMEEICNQMATISQYPLSYMIQKFIIKPSFPVKVNEINYSKHDVDGLLLSFVKWIKREKGYKFLNVLDDDTYVIALLDNYRTKVEVTINLLYNEERLFEEVKRYCDYPLIDLDNKNIKIGHITQLFPLLEMKIRELAINTGYFPFKENNDGFMQYNDPSSVLREIIKKSCEDIHGFDPVPDLYFVYNCMYSSNSLNIRNECIHGRGYITDNGLHFALRATLISILMIEERLEIIFHNRRVKAKNKVD